VLKIILSVLVCSCAFNVYAYSSMSCWPSYRASDSLFKRIDIEKSVSEVKVRYTDIFSSEGVVKMKLDGPLVLKETLKVKIVLELTLTNEVKTLLIKYVSKESQAVEYDVFDCY